MAATYLGLNRSPFLLMAYSTLPAAFETMALSSELRTYWRVPEEVAHAAVPKDGMAICESRIAAQIVVPALRSAMFFVSDMLLYVNR